MNVDKWNVDKWIGEMLIGFSLCERRFLRLGNVSELPLLSLVGNVDMWICGYVDMWIG